MPVDPCFACFCKGNLTVRFTLDFDRWSAERSLKKLGADRSWTACFVTPNATCPACSAPVYYYENSFGSRVFFDELGWPWPKHGCTDNSAGKGWTPSVKAPETRERGATIEILSSAQAIDFDPGSSFRSKFGASPWDLLTVLAVARRGFENFIEAKSISPHLDEPVLVAFTSAKIIPVVGEFFGFDGNAVSFLDRDALRERKLKAMCISRIELEAAREQDAALQRNEQSAP
jgi:hypothetical protein